MTNRLDIRPLDASFGAVVHGLKLAAINDEDFDAMYAAWLQYGLLIFPEQHLSREQQISLAKRFGPLEIEMAVMTNVRADGTLRTDPEGDEVLKMLRGNTGWHADSTYMPVQSKGAVLSSEVVPKAGGQTGFADMRAAYDALDDAVRKRVDSLCAHHSIYYSQSKIGHVVTKPGRDGEYHGYGFHAGPVPLRPLVKVHPETGRKSLAIGRHAYNIPGMSAEASEQFLQELVDFACQPPRVYEHAWKPGETVIWDNRCLLHRAMPWDLHEPRMMCHTRLAGDPVTEAALLSALRATS